MKQIDASTLCVLLVSDEGQWLSGARDALRTSGVTNVVALNDSGAVWPVLTERGADVLVLDLTMPVSGQGLLERARTDYPDVAVIVLTAKSGLDVLTQSAQAGAIDYLVKPVDNNRLVSAVKRALEILALRAEILSLKESLLTDTTRQRAVFPEMITQNKAMSAIFRYLEAIASSPQPVLITGESGTGKELIAKALHRLSRRSGNLVAVNVAGLDDTMFSDTLFGHSKGSFTGADRPRDGLVTSAEHGTLFLDEIGDLPVASQVKLLRLLQDGSYFALGADRPRQSLARVVVSTNCDVAHQVAEGRFRRDLYYRLRTHHLHLPALRAREGDLPLLINHFVEKAAGALAKPVPNVPAALYQLLKTYSFPGNVRELEALIFDAVARHQGAVLSLQSFRDTILSKPELLEPEPPSEGASAPLANWLADQLPTLDQAEAVLIAEALRRADGNQGVAAGILGISRQALNKRLTRRKRSDLSPDLPG